MGLDIQASAKRYGAVGTPPQTVGFKALYVGSGGDIGIRDAVGGTEITFTGVPAGTILPVAGQVVETGPTDMTWLNW